MKVCCISAAETKAVEGLAGAAATVLSLVDRLRKGHECALLCLERGLSVSSIQMGAEIARVTTVDLSSPCG